MSRALKAGIAAWTVATAAGMLLMWNYESTPAAAAVAATQWPSESRVPHGNDRPTVVMLAHPRCTCTRASLSELASMMPRIGDRADVRVLFVKPPGTEESFVSGDTWKQANAIPGVSVMRDEGGVEAARFGVHASGHTLVYDASGKLLFSGGITGARGHVGDNLGKTRVLELLAGGKPDRDTSPVFGCPMHDG